MTTPDRPVGGSTGPGEEGVVRVFPAPPVEPEPVAPVPPVGGTGEPRPTPYPTTAPPTTARPTSPPPGTPRSGGDSSTADAAKSAAGDVKDQAASSASDVKDTAAQQANAVAGTAQQQAAQVKDTAAGAASDVAATARDQAQNVIGEASQQARQLADSLTTQLNEQASTQQQRAAGSLRELAQGVSDMAEGRGAPSGPLGDYTRQAADRLQTAAGYLENKQPGELLDDVRSFAARRPAAFLLGAAVAGFAVGRFVKGAKGASDSGTTSGSTSGYSGAAPTTGSLQDLPGGSLQDLPGGSLQDVPGGSLQDVPSAGTGFGNPTVPPMPTPAPGYSDRIPTGPTADEPYPTDGTLGRDEVRQPSRSTPGVSHGDPLTEDVSGLYPGTPGGDRGV